MDWILDSKERRLLEGRRLAPRKSFAGRVRGERLTRRKGVSIEFADYRDYTDGDDLRHLDWNVLARLDVPIMKTYRDEEDLAVYLLVDETESMSFGQPPKAEVARRVAAAFGYVGLAGGDAVRWQRLGIREPARPFRRSVASYLRLAGDAAPSSEADRRGGVAEALRSFARQNVRAGLVLVVSDGLDPEIAGAVKILFPRGHEVWFVQVLGPEEIDPDLEGDLRLLDSEGGSPVEITANGLTLREYRRRLEEHNASLAEAVRRGGGRYALLRTDEPLEALLAGPVRREGWMA